MLISPAECRFANRVLLRQTLRGVEEIGSSSSVESFNSQHCENVTRLRVLNQQRTTISKTIAPVVYRDLTLLSGRQTMPLFDMQFVVPAQAPQPCLFVWTCSEIISSAWYVSCFLILSSRGWTGCRTLCMCSYMRCILSFQKQCSNLLYSGCSQDTAADN